MEEEREELEQALHRIESLEQELAQAKAPVGASPAGKALSLRWFGWGTGTFLSFLVHVPLPVFSAMLAGLWVSRGQPRVIPFELPLPLFALLVLLAGWNVLVLFLNHRNEIVLATGGLTVRCGLVPWPISYSRRRVPASPSMRFEVEEEWDPESEATSYRVAAMDGDRRHVLTGDLGSSARAESFAEALGDFAKAHWL